MDYYYWILFWINIFIFDVGVNYVFKKCMWINKFVVRIGWFEGN